MAFTKNSQKFIGDYFKHQREKANLSQKQVSDVLGYTTAQFVSNWERGLITPPFTALPTLIKLYGLSKKDVVNIFVTEYRKTIEGALDKKR